MSFSSGLVILDSLPESLFECFAVPRIDGTHIQPWGEDKSRLGNDPETRLSKGILPEGKCSIKIVLSSPRG